MNPYPLFDFIRPLPVAGLFKAPTPVDRVGERLWLKRDDLSAADYGGNKIRKLDLILADAQRRGATELLTFGYAGSNFVAATAWHGRKLGLHTIAYLLPQADASYVADNLAVGLASGAELHPCNTQAAIARAALIRSATALLRKGRAPYWVAPGGSSALGTLGFVNAALELRAQVEAGVLPAPDTIYVAFSSMGTVAGLAVGLEAAGLNSSVVAVQVVSGAFASPRKLRRLAQRTAGLCGVDGRAALGRVSIRTEFYGDEYARPTGQTLAAVQRFEGATGARADSAYSGKALACLYHDLDAGRAGRMLFWHTFNAHGLPGGIGRPTSGPAGLRHYLGSGRSPS